MKNDTNSKVYWDKRFEEDWEEKNGGEQTRAFYALLLKELPAFVAQFIETKTETINDLGCAFGDGTQLIQAKFPKQLVEGTDFSSAAIANAKQKYTNLKFDVQDINHLPKAYDVMIASNVLEHFTNPLSILKKIIKSTKKLIIIMLPFQEEVKHLISEHTQSFDFKDFPITISDSLLIYSKEIVMAGIPEEQHWHGKQILLVYAKKNIYPQEEISLENYHYSNIDKDEKINELRLLKDEFAKINLNYERLREKSLKLQVKTNSLKETNVLLNDELDKIKVSSAWKITQSYYRLLEKNPSLKKVVRILKKQ